MKNKIIRVISAVLIVVFALAVYAPGVFAATQSELESKNAQLEKQIAEKQAKINSLKGDISQQKEYVATLYSQIDDMNAQIAIVQEKIDAINSDISTINTKIENKQSEIDEKQEKIDSIVEDIKAQEEEIKGIIELLCERLRAVYMAGNASTLEMLLSCDDIASFLTTSEMLKRVADYDDALVKELNSIIDQLNESKTKLEESKKKLVEAKNELDSEKQALESKKSEQEAEKAVYTTQQNQISSKMQAAQKIVNSLDAQSDAYKLAIKNYESEMAANEARIQAIIRNASQGSSSGSSGSSSGNSSGNSSGRTDNNTVTSSGKFICPVPYSSAYVSSGYGYRNSFLTASGQYSSSFHGGTDITCSGASNYDKKVVASRAGTVISATWMNGYGNCVMIDHGDGYVTLYGHNNSILVSTGQYVKQGQAIAIMGMTGNATGPHCHFEIRYNGSKVNPMSYISVP